METKLESLPLLLSLNKEHGHPIKKEYLAYVTEGSRRGIKLSSEAGALSPTANFAIEPVKGGLVHIRSTYNFKYLCRESSESWSIAAGANEAVEDMAKWNCTLFRPQTSGNGSTVSLFHTGTDGKEYGITLDSKEILQIDKNSGTGTIFNVVNVGLKVRLPRRIAFKGDNGKYLKAIDQEGHPYNEFSSNDKSDIRTHYEIFTTKDGDIRVHSVHVNKFWRRSRNQGDWIWSDSVDDTTDNPDTVFEVVKVGDNVIALRDQGSKKFCKRVTKECKESCLNADVDNVVTEARLIVEEPVFSRKIQIQYRFEDARIYDKKPIQAATVSVNNSTNKEHKLTQSFSYTETHFSSWNTTTGFKIGTKASVEAGIPLFVNGQFEVSGEVSHSVTIGESNNLSKQITSSYAIDAPPMTRATINLLASEAKYDIPYSYYQIDSYTTGEQVTTFSEDGIYHGIQDFDFHYEPKYEPIPAPQLAHILNL